METRRENWPELNYTTWKPTYETIHRWTQIVGKARLCHEPWTNHSWHSTLYVSSRGLTTSAVSNGFQNFTIEFDFINDRLLIQDSRGGEKVLPLHNESVALFYGRFMRALKELGIKVNFDPHPNEVMDALAFQEDSLHHTYNHGQALTFWRALVQINNIFKEFRSHFIGKCSPVHFFWGSFDLAVTRFSGRRAPEHPGGVPHLSDLVTREAYSHEVSSLGFWPGNDLYPHAAFYSYAYPEPPGFREAKLQPAQSFYHEGFHEFILPYEEVIRSQDPRMMLLEFAQSAYEAAANLGNWDRQLLEQSLYLSECQQCFAKI